MSMLLSFLMVIVISMIIHSGTTSGTAVVSTFYIAISFMAIGILLAMCEMTYALQTVSQEIKTVTREFSMADITQGMNP
jgi:hypothetical protein